jgi:hypothetical protein
MVPRLSPERKQALTQFLVEHLEQAEEARHEFVKDGGLYDIAHGLYEQAQRSRPGAWPGAADLASYLPTEKVDALKARFMKILFGPDPVCYVEGWGETDERCAKVEAFHQWKLEDTRLQSIIAKAIHVALIEQNGILEVCDAYRTHKLRDQFMAKAKGDAFGGAELDAEGEMTPEKDEAGRLVPWQGDERQPRVEVIRESAIGPYANGPAYRLINSKDFQFLPAHAKSEDEVFGRFKRCWVRLSDLEARVDDKLYDKDAVAKIGKDSERDQRAEHARQSVVVQSREDQTAEKELWEGQVLYDIDGDGVDEWLYVCLSLRHQVLLRVAYDPIPSSRFINFVPFPRPDSVWGYSFLLHKLWTIADAHTAQRNMIADRSALATKAPMTRRKNSVYEPDEEPWAPGALLTVTDHDDLKPLIVPDVPASAQWIVTETLGAAERVTGIGDQAVSGVKPTSGQTATGASIVAQAAYVRVEDAIMHLRESLEDLYLLNNAFWIRALEQNELLGRYPAKGTQALDLERRGIQLPEDGPFAFKAADLRGSFRFKPAGSTETADKQIQRQEFSVFISQALPAILQMSPQLAQMMQMNPRIGIKLMESALRLYDMRDLQAEFAKLLGPTGAQPEMGAGAMSPMLSGLLQMVGGAGGAGGPMPGALPPVPAPPVDQPPGVM